MQFITKCKMDDNIQQRPITKQYEKYSKLLQLNLYRTGDPNLFFNQQRLWEE